MVSQRRVSFTSRSRRESVVKLGEWFTCERGHRAALPRSLTRGLGVTLSGAVAKSIPNPQIPKSPHWSPQTSTTHLHSSPLLGRPPQRRPGPCHTSSSQGFSLWSSRMSKPRISKQAHRAPLRYWGKHVR